MRDAIVFVPGFFGFGAFGPNGAPIIEYFKFARTVLRAELGPDVVVLMHQPPPTGPLALRAASLHKSLENLLTDGVDSQPVHRVHLIGHSTGGVDARLVSNAKYLWPGAPDRAQRKSVIDRIASVTTISAPHRGAPLAANLRPGMELAIPALWFASILASRDALSIAGHAGTVLETLEQMIISRTTPEWELIARLANVDAKTAQDIRRFLDEVVRDHRLVGDLTPDAMTLLNRDIAGADHEHFYSVVSVAPAPKRSLSNASMLLRDPLRRALYLFTYNLSRSVPPVGARWPVGSWVLGRPEGLRVDEPGANDGIVPTWSQTLDGRAECIVCSDHLDIIGHYQGAGTTFFRSGSGFDDEVFRSAWRRISAVVQRHRV
jgi:pimeloyl-ACP methyl ester carboxylesterase